MGHILPTGRMWDYAFASFFEIVDGNDSPVLRKLKPRAYRKKRSKKMVS
jgi:hypothetical protein